MTGRPSRGLVLLLALAVVLFMPGCALVHVIVPLPTPTPSPQYALRPTFTPTPMPPATPEAPAEPAPDEARAAEAPAVELLAPPEPEANPEAAAQAESPVAEAASRDTPTPAPPPPSPTPTSAPLVVVQADQVRARSGPGSNYDQVGELAQGLELPVLGRNEDSSWWQVCCVQGQPAWVTADLVSLQGSAEAVALAADIPASPTPDLTPYAVVLNPNVNVRSGPGTDFEVLVQVDEGTRWQIIGRDGTGQWWQVCCIDGQEGWLIGELVRTEGASDQVAIAANVPEPASLPTPTPAAVAASPTESPNPAATPGNYVFQLVDTESFPFQSNDYFRVGVRVSDLEDNPLGNTYLRILNETTGQQWLSRRSGDRMWEYSAPSADFGDFREVNVQFDTNGQAPLAGMSYAVWLVDGGGRQVSPVVRYQQGDDEFQWLYVVFTLQ